MCQKLGCVYLSQTKKASRVGLQLLLRLIQTHPIFLHRRRSLHTIKLNPIIIHNRVGISMGIVSKPQTKVNLRPIYMPVRKHFDRHVRKALVCKVGELFLTCAKFKERKSAICKVIHVVVITYLACNSGPTIHHRYLLFACGTTRIAEGMKPAISNGSNHRT